MMINQGKRDRAARLRTNFSGGWGSDHVHMITVVGKLYALSKSEARSGGGNTSWVPYAGIPLLVSALQSFVIEYECTGSFNRAQLEPLTRSGQSGLLEMLETRYGAKGELLGEAKSLMEIRNEMTHPVPLPAGTADNCPEYLRQLKTAGLLESTGEATDYRFMAQLASHRLFAWSCRVTRDLFRCVITSNPKKPVKLLQQFVDYLTRIGFESDLP